MEKTKNCWVIPTDKPSRLSYDFDIKQYYLQDKNSFWKHQYLIENRNIHITSDEEIKEGDWFMDISDNSIWKNEHSGKMVKSIFPECKKIILTTDQDLIKHGVQAINDEFLEWFCSKNGKVDFVEVIAIKDEKN